MDGLGEFACELVAPREPCREPDLDLDVPLSEALRGVRRPRAAGSARGGGGAGALLPHRGGGGGGMA